MVWNSHLSKNIPQFVVSHRVKDFSIGNKVEEDVVFLVGWLVLIQCNQFQMGLPPCIATLHFFSSC